MVISLQTRQSLQDCNVWQANFCCGGFEGSRKHYNSVIKSLRCFNREIKSEDFDRDNTITYQGVRVEMVRENGSSWMKFTGVDGKAAT